MRRSIDAGVVGAAARTGRAAGGWAAAGAIGQVAAIAAAQAGTASRRRLRMAAFYRVRAGRGVGYKGRMRGTFARLAAPLLAVVSACQVQVVVPASPDAAPGKAAARPSAPATTAMPPLVDRPPPASCPPTPTPRPTPQMAGTPSASPVPTSPRPTPSRAPGEVTATLVARGAGAPAGPFAATRVVTGGMLATSCCGPRLFIDADELEPLAAGCDPAGAAVRRKLAIAVPGFTAAGPRYPVGEGAPGLGRETEAVVRFEADGAIWHGRGGEVVVAAIADRRARLALRGITLVREDGAAAASLDGAADVFASWLYPFD